MCLTTLSTYWSTLLGGIVVDERHISFVTGICTPLVIRKIALTELLLAKLLTNYEVEFQLLLLAYTCSSSSNIFHTVVSEKYTSVIPSILLLCIWTAPSCPQLAINLIYHDRIWQLYPAYIAPQEFACKVVNEVHGGMFSCELLLYQFVPQCCWISLQYLYQT